MSFQIYIPYICDIEDIISVDKITVVTTTIVHAFVPGNLVGFSIPKEWGMRQLTGLKGYVIEVTDDTVLVNIDSSMFDLFVTPTVTPPNVIDPAQILPIGDANTGTLAPGGVLESLTIPGAFQAIVI